MKIEILENSVTVYNEGFGMLRQHLNIECRIQSNVNCYVLEFNLYENKMNVIKFDDFLPKI